MLSRLAGDAFYFMQTSNPVESVALSSIPALKAASAILLYAARTEPDLLLRLLSESGPEASNEFGS